MSEHDSVSLQPDTWGDVDRYVEALVGEVRERRLLVLTEAFIFRDRQAAGLLALPCLVLEEAGRILARLRELVPETLPDQLVVLLAWTGMGPDGIDVGIRELRWTREGLRRLGSLTSPTWLTTRASSSTPMDPLLGSTAHCEWHHHA